MAVITTIMLKTYDVTITITNISAKTEAEAVRIARTEAGIRDSGYIEIEEVEE